MPGFKLLTDEERKLYTAARALPDLKLHVLTLRKVYGHTQEQIAERLHISEAEVEPGFATAACALADAISPPTD